VAHEHETIGPNETCTVVAAQHVTDLAPHRIGRQNLPAHRVGLDAACPVDVASDGSARISSGRTDVTDHHVRVVQPDAHLGLGPPCGAVARVDRVHRVLHLNRGRDGTTRTIGQRVRRAEAHE